MNFLLHGNMGNASDWSGFPGEAVDLWKKSDLELWDWASDFCGDVRAKGADSNFLVGYSMGGRLALHALIEEPELWDGALIISAHPGLGDAGARESRRAQDQVLADEAREWTWDTFSDKWNAQPVLANGEVSFSQAGLESRRESVARGFENWSLGMQDDLRERLAEVDVPVLWITGERDEKFSALGNKMSRVMPNCEHVRVLDCGHRVIFEQRDILRELLLEGCGADGL